MALSKDAKNLHFLVKHAPITSEKWEAEVVGWNPSLGIKQVDVHPALKVLKDLGFIKATVESQRDPENHKKLKKRAQPLDELPYVRIEYLGDPRIKTKYIIKYLDLEILREVRLCNGIKMWIGDYCAWPPAKKVAQLTARLRHVNQCFYWLNLRSAISGRDALASDRAQVLKS